MIREVSGEAHFHIRREVFMIAKKLKDFINGLGIVGREDCQCAQYSKKYRPDNPVIHYHI